MLDTSREGKRSASIDLPIEEFECDIFCCSKNIGSKSDIMNNDTYISRAQQSDVSRITSDISSNLVKVCQKKKFYSEDNPDKNLK